MAVVIPKFLILAVCFVLTQQQATDTSSSIAQKPEASIHCYHFDLVDETYDDSMANRTSAFHFEKRIQSNGTAGCRGYISGAGRGHIMYYISDGAGFRMIHPDESNKHLLPDHCLRILSTQPIMTLIAQFRGAEGVCIDILEVPEQYHNLVRQYPYPATHYMKCVLRCTGIINGVYSDREGANLSGLYKALHVEAGSSITWDQFQAESVRCMASVSKRSHGAPIDVCEKAYSIYHCFEKQYHKVLGCNKGPSHWSSGF